MIIARDKYLRQLIEARGNGMVKIVTGMRRSGKSFLLMTTAFFCGDFFKNKNTRSLASYKNI